VNIFYERELTVWSAFLMSVFSSVLCVVWCNELVFGYYFAVELWFRQKSYGNKNVL